MFRRLSIIALAALAALALPVGCRAQVAPLVLSSCDDPAEWTAGAADRENVKEGKASLLWDHAEADSVGLVKVPQDWSAYDRLSFWLHSRQATGSRFLIIFSSEDPASEGMDYYSYGVTLNFTGWKAFKLYLPGLGESREPLGWKQIQSVRFTASGWGNTPNPEAVVSIDGLVLTHEGKEVGPRMSDKDLFEALDLARPGMEAVAAAYNKGDLAAAKAGLATYYRQRQTPRWFVAPIEKADPKPDNPDVSRAERVLRHEMESIGIRHAFGPVIDWNFDKTTEPGSTLAPNNEWTWQLNRHADWGVLANAYRDTGDEKYAREWMAQMTQWVRDCRMPDDAGNGARSAWRTIETGIRAAGMWPNLFYRFLHSPEFNDEALVTMLKGFADHARHLMEYHTTGNWLAMEGNGLFHVGVIFPEFRDAPAWRKTGIGWLYDEMNVQVYPDGVQIELSSGYHHVSLGNFLGAYRVAKLNDVPVPDDYLQRLQKMYDFDVYGAMPDGRLPGVQDGNNMSIVRYLREASELFPERKDYQWYATDGKEGAAPTEGSHAFPYAGYYVMRSGWEPDARWLWLDGGPFGYGHQHEDKLNLILHAYGKLLLVDPGNFQYERSKWRSYFIDSPAHNVVLVDGQSQRRRGQPRGEYVVKEPMPHIWEAAAGHDYAEATFDEGFAGDVGANVTHTRRVLFVKPDYWVVLDTLAAKDGKPHAYEALFHFDAPVAPDAAGLRVFTANADAANLAVVARPDAGLSLKVIEGQEDPVQGWLPSGDKKVRPAPVAVFRAEGRGETHLLWVLAPAPAGQPDPVAAVEPVAGNPLAARIRFRDGRDHLVTFSGGAPADVRAGNHAARARVVLAETRADGTAGRRIAAGDP